MVQADDGFAVKPGRAASSAEDGAGEAGELVGVGGFEPPTSRSRTERSTKLSHTPDEMRL